MTAAEFIAKWRGSTLGERQAAQSHFNDLCRLLGVPGPTDDDTQGERYCFERGAGKTGGGNGWADVWRKGCFAWEYKGKHRDLDAALRQVTAYARDLENPPYLVVSDMDRIIVHTNWTNTVPRTYALSLDDLLEPAKLHLLRAVWEGSDELKPTVSPQELTAKAAERFGELSKRLQDRGHEPRAVAHFLNQLLFCMFAEDAKLLKDGLFTRLIKATQTRPDAAKRQLSELFEMMSQPGDTYFGVEFIRWFNGGLFDGAAVLPLERIDLELIARTAEEHDWTHIDPSVFGTLFEQALSATRERPALGAHYTDREKILKIVEPVIVRPLRAEWEAVLATATAAMARVEDAEAERRAVLEQAGEDLKIDAGAAKAGETARRKRLDVIAKRRTAARAEAHGAVEVWLARLSEFRVLDPACGSGNFLYVALHELLDLEQRAIVDAERLGLSGFLPRVDLRAVRGIEIERYAAELARLTLWIGYLQWVLKGAKPPGDPVLSSLDQIECRDALLNPDGSEAAWPAVDVIVGNPPFLGGKRMRDGLGDAAVERLFAAYRGKVPAEADLVAYWVEKAWRQVVATQTTRVGLVTTNSMRGGANRRVLDPICDADAMWEAWADEAWAVEGAAVRVSMLGFGEGFSDRCLNGAAVEQINADLTSTNIDVRRSGRLSDNAGVSFQGPVLIGPFQISGEQARHWLRGPLNPNGMHSSDVLRPIRNASDLVGRSSDRWVIDFGRLKEEQAALYQAPFGYVLREVKPEREQNRRAARAMNWWMHGELGEGWKNATSGTARYLVTPRVAKHRIFVWLSSSVFPDSRLFAFARDDDASFGLMQSRFHEVWSLATCSWHGVGNDPTYNNRSCFETFPFPEGLTPNIPAADYADDPRAMAIAGAAKRLNDLREAWLNPPDLTVRVAEVVPGCPDRILAKDEAAAAVLKKRTLTNLYNERPRWLAMAHETLDAAVAAAYGWPADLTDDEVLERLFALNQERAAAGR